MLKSASWRCDVCGEEIKQPEHGLVEWVTYKDAQNQPKGRDLRLVHDLSSSPRKDNGGCLFDEKHEHNKDRGVVGAIPLSRLVGHDGLMQLLCLIVEGDIPQLEIIELIKRLHIPGYEDARFYLNKVTQEDILEPTIGPGFYRQSEIKAILEWAKKESD